MTDNADSNKLAMAANQQQPLPLPIEDLIHVIRGQQVMLDSDLARLYGVETKRLKEQVRRNINRFPEDFMFELTKDDCLRSQIATLNTERGRHIKYMPFAFTEQGVAMLSSVLRSDTAVEVNIRIMRAFTAMRNFMLSNANVFRRLETIEHHQLLLHERQTETDKKIEEVLTRLNKNESEQIEGFFFEGQIFDAYTLISDLVRTANNRIILIDNYVDDKVLKVLDKRKECVSATIYTNPKHSHISIDLKKHNAQYSPIEVKSCVNVHDRFLITDNTVYFIGGSIKDLGKKIVAFSRMHQNPDDIITKVR